MLVQVVLIVVVLVDGDGLPPNGNVKRPVGLFVVVILVLVVTTRNGFSPLPLLYKNSPRVGDFLKVRLDIL
jgi:hypothetical protein